MSLKENAAMGCLPMFLILWGSLFGGIPIFLLIQGGNDNPWIAFVFIPIGFGAIAGGVWLWRQMLYKNHVMKHGTRLYAKLLSIKETGSARRREGSRRSGRVTGWFLIEFEWRPPNQGRPRTDQQKVSLDISANLPEIGSQFRVFADPDQPDKCLVEDEPIFKSSSKTRPSPDESSLTEPQEKSQSPAPGFTRERLSDSDPVGTTQGYGTGAAIFGLVFIIAGMFPVLIGLGVITPQKGSVHAPLWVIGFFGGLFVLAGLSVSLAGLKGRARTQKLEKERASRPKQPWLWDYDWEPLGISSGSSKKIRKQIIAVFGIGLFLVPFNWVVFNKMQAHTMPKVIIGLFDLILVIAFGHAVYLILQHLKYGESRLSFGDFPFSPGRTMQVTLNNLPSNVETLKLDLRYIEEVWETSGTGKNKNTRQVCYQLYKNSRTLSGTQLNPRDRLPMKWNLPEGKQFTTRLSEMPLRYWQLEASSETQGIDYNATFLLPVYAKPPSPLQ